ncbi:hypothetical protein EV180_000566 [Coemansia sp. RSA 518]|nr:hypothetical protein IW142_001857 [Coemansia sp. RSA 564]KAJ2206543.1 hypothetical protein IW145_002066 [Coemansia sp. RSA 521]KAJ2231125.1 hypothetical protein EV180_000566 [Coemansia sp. RSA 518]KAJ2274964.1 hypothetical protein J3F81_002026 [Coemansia sp. RSA 371]KAJ2288379.1 hypothetical protein IW141_004398 [Coemansia sp. RSA 355]KAJ2444412.1 hypothetical protein IWW46_002037 [Coemansia sp. RSA 2440]
MDVEYLDPCRYDYDTSDDECPTDSTPSFVVRLKPVHSVPRTTLVISLVPFNEGEQIGLIYSSAQPPQLQPFSNSTQTTTTLSRIYWAHSMHVVAATSLPAELQFGWVQKVCEKISPTRIVVVDAKVSGQSEFRSPAVLASALVLGLPAAVMNYAEVFGVPCRHVRDCRMELTAERVDALFESKQQEHVADNLDTLDHSVVTSLYV